MISVDTGPKLAIRENLLHLTRKHASDALRKGRIPVREERVATMNVIGIEQWICFVLGVICISSGILGISMKHPQDLSSPYVAWLGSGYVPTLRLTAAACLAMGGMLVRRGWTAPGLQQTDCF